MPTDRTLFAVDQFRPERRRLARVREVVRPTLVLGSTQLVELVRRDALWGREVDVARRRGGGGAVYLAPGGQLWLDVWIPHRDPLWARDVSVAAEWVGSWWVEALRDAGLGGFDVHSGRADPGALGDLVCFAGRGPGEVFHGGRKVVGLSQWRAREGALFSSCAYRRWEPQAIVDLLHIEGRVPAEGDLKQIGVGLSELDPPFDDLGRVREALLASLPDFVAPADRPGGGPA